MIPAIIAACLGSPPSYEDCYANAIRDGRPFVVFVGVPSMPGPWIAHECASFPGVPGKGVILSRPQGGYLEWVDTLDWWTDAGVIERRLREVALPPRKWNPYQQRSLVAPPRPASFSAGGVSC